MWQVLDNNKPAKGWRLDKDDEDIGRYEFDSFEEAHDYAVNWLGRWGSGLRFQPNTEYDYSGYGDTIQIKKIIRK
jgi:hypothetical protein